MVINIIKTFCNSDPDDPGRITIEKFMDGGIPFYYNPQAGELALKMAMEDVETFGLNEVTETTEGNGKYTFYIKNYRRMNNG